MAVQPLVDRGEPLLDQVEHIRHRVLTDKPPRNPSLVRHHDDREPRATQQTHRLEAPRIEPQPVESVDIADILDESSVAIEKHSRTRHSHWQTSGSCWPAPVW